jgi:hypothetical protein
MKTSVMKPQRIGVAFTLLAIVTSAMAAAQARSSDSPARLKLNLERLAPKAVEVADVTLEGPMLRFAAALAGSDHDAGDKQAAAMLQQLKGIYVRSFTFAKDGEYSIGDIIPIQEQLHGHGWSRIVSVRDTGERDEIYVMTDAGGKIQGMAIIAAEPRELSVVNIVGAIDPADLAHLEGNFGIPKIGETPKPPAPPKPPLPPAACSGCGRNGPAAKPAPPPAPASPAPPPG